LVEKAYLDEDLVRNVERFKTSKEFYETKKIITRYCPAFPSLKILDVGSGNGISAVSFALGGSEVAVVEPDNSKTVGTGAIRELARHYGLSRIEVFDTYAEHLPFQPNSFDMVYVRQAMHHANDLVKFVNECTRVLKKGGLFLTVRDHVVYDQKDKEWFLGNHPLQKYYGGENAFTLEEYSHAMRSAGLVIKEVLKHFDSVINYFPMEEKEIEHLKANRKNLMDASLKRKLPLFLANSSGIKKYYSKYIELKLGSVLNEASIPGRLYSFIAIKSV
jgi:ubiquinone/menaquinone biosynthesis C-methylase UbiE